MVQITKDIVIESITKGKRNSVILLYCCYKDLFDLDERSSIIILLIKEDIGITINKMLVSRIKKSRNNIPLNYYPSWRNTASSDQVNTSHTSSFPSSQNSSNNIDRSIKFKEIRYHKSLKSYNFDYPWFELDGDGIPRPAKTGDTEEARKQYFSDRAKYDAIKKIYVVPDEVRELQKNETNFKKIRKDGFHPSQGGFHPLEEINNKI